MLLSTILRRKMRLKKLKCFGPCNKVARAFLQNSRFRHIFDNVSFFKFKFLIKHDWKGGAISPAILNEIYLFNYILHREQ